jgi:hypothetical protein
MTSLDHGCTVRTHHLPLPYVLVDHYLVPESWQLQLYEEVRISDSHQLCPTHDAHAHLARDAAVGAICFGVESPFDRRQFGRELWSWGEDAAFWLRSRLDSLPENFAWRTSGEFTPQATLAGYSSTPLVHTTR